MEKQTNAWKAAFFGLLILILLVGVAVFSYFLGKGMSSPTKPSPLPTLSSELTTPQIQSTPTPTPTLPDEELLKRAIYQLTGLDETKAEVTISENTGTHAKGGIREYNAVGGAYWLAAKVNGQWVGVYHGQANPSCEKIAPYSFPSEMVPECIDSGGNIISR